MLFLGVWLHWPTFHSYEADLYTPFPTDSCLGFFKLICLLICYYRNTTEYITHSCLALTFIRNVFSQSVGCLHSQQTVSTILLMGTSTSDETEKVFEGHRGSLYQKENMNASLSRSRLDTWASPFS